MLEIDSILKARLSRFIASDILEALPDTGAITRATQRLSSLHKTISSFLPLYIAENEEILTQDYGNLSPGTFMFADVSGFTALSERLMMRAGSVSTEVLTKVFNDYFATMLEILAKSDGQLLKFAGDALLAFFPEVQGSDEFHKAINTGLRMQRAMRERFQPIQNASLEAWFKGEEQGPELTMSIGISKGILFEALVGSIAQRDHMIMGRLPGEADAAEEAGLRDDVIIHASMRERYIDVFATKELAPGFFQIIDNFGDELGDYEFSMPSRRRAKSSFLFSFDDEDLLEDLTNQLNRLENITRFVSSEIVNKLVVTGDHIESENRLATVIFVHFTGFAELLDAWGEENTGVLTVILSRYYNTMQRIINANGGVLTRSDPYKLGSKLLITFGAPVAHPDDAERAVTTALEMKRQLDIFNQRLRTELPQELVHLYPFVRQRAGITQGDVFAGEVGWRQRREYTVMGDDVNLAARLMSRAEFGTVIMSERVWERVNPYFETEPLEPFYAKGKSAAIQSYRAIQLRRSSIARTSDTPFIGRKVTLAVIKSVLMKAQKADQHVEAIALQGEIGVGKTRLAKEITDTASIGGLDFRVVWATCRSQNTRKSTWATLVSQILEIDPNLDQTTGRDLLHERLTSLNLLNLQEVLMDILFDVSDQTPTTKTRADRRDESETRRDIFDKLSSDATLAMRKDSLAEFRNQMKMRLAQRTTRGVIDWNELQRGMSLTEALLTLLQSYSQNQPLLIVIDDLHKENQRAMNMLRRIINELQSARIVFIFAYELVRQLELDVRKIVVSDLTPDETYSMVTAILDNNEIGELLWEYVWESTSGRALFVESLVHTLREQNALQDNQGIIEIRKGVDLEAVPDDIRGLVISRVDRLSADARTLIRAGAVFGDRFSQVELMVVSELSESVVARTFQQLLDIQIFEDSQDGFYRFKHGVTQQAVYEELTRIQRQNLHLKVADYFEQNLEAEQNIISLVHHLIRGGKLLEAVETFRTAAENAEANSNIEQALEFYTLALEIYPDDKDLQANIERLQNIENG